MEGILQRMLYRLKYKKNKVFPVLYLIKHCAMKTSGGRGCIDPPFLTSALDGGEWSASRPGRFTPRERNPCTHWIGVRVDLKAGLDAVKKNSLPLPGIELRPSIPKPVAIPT
jgi:hypothetical protein